MVLAVENVFQFVIVIAVEPAQRHLFLRGLRLRFHIPMIGAAVPEMARLMLARKIAAIALIVWNRLVPRWGFLKRFFSAILAQKNRAVPGPCAMIVQKLGRVRESANG